MSKQKKVENTSGIEPLEYNIVVKPKEIGSKVNGVFIPDEYKDRARVSATEGIVLAVSPTAFDYVEDESLRKKISVDAGDKVIFPRHNAMEFDGKDGGKYFIL
ncbi:MAG: co-chaperone GroES family protein [Pseudomonadota bacterium]